MSRTARLPAAVAVLVASALTTPEAQADNSRLNDGVVANVYTVQQKAGCDTDVKISPPLRLAAQWHANDVLRNRALDGDLGSDGSTPQSRAAAAGFAGAVAETVAINNSFAINNLDVINQWFHNPVDYSVMADCANTAIGVWSESNGFDRSVVVAVYGQPV